MEHGTSVTSLVIVIVAAFLTPIILHRFKLTMIPVVVAEIIIGLIIGNSGFNIVQPDDWLEILSTLGFIFLMFLSGLEIDFQAFSSSKKGKNKTKGPNPLTVSLIIFTSIFIISYGLSFLFVLAGFIESAMLMTIIISTISLGVVVPTLKEENLMKKPLGQIILLVAVIADLATMILLAVFVSFNDGGDGNTWLLLVLFAVGILLYFVGRRFKNGKLIKSLSTGTIQIGTRAIFTLIIFLVALSETVGAENILGAFLAGVLVSLLSPSKELVAQLDSFGYGFLIPIFFVMVGVDLDLWSLLKNPKMLALIPLLLLALFISKMIPALFLRKWYRMKSTLASGFLLTSTLSLVIAAATIGEKIGMISKEMSGTLILVAVISCIIAPMIFKKLLPKQETEEKQITVAIIGANQLTLPVYQDLASSLIKPTLFHRKQEKLEKGKKSESVFSIVELEDYSEESLQKHNVFNYDVAVISTGDEQLNAKLAKVMKAHEMERVIARIESPEIEEKLQDNQIEIFSVIQTQHVLLRTLIESPSMIDLLTNRETSLYEIKIRNREFDHMPIRKFPFTGDIVFVRIFCGSETIIPHGDTELRVNDRLIVSGTKKYANELKRELEFRR